MFNCLFSVFKDIFSWLSYLSVLKQRKCCPDLSESMLRWPNFVQYTTVKLYCTASYIINYQILNFFLIQNAKVWKWADFVCRAHRPTGKSFHAVLQSVDPMWKIQPFDLTQKSQPVFSLTNVPPSNGSLCAIIGATTCVTFQLSNHVYVFRISQ